MAETRRQILFLILAVLTSCLLVQGEFRDCNNPLGMENRLIPDINIVATTRSYQNNPMFGARHARLNSLSGYRADPTEGSLPYISVQLPKEMIITGIATQGVGEEWVTKYKMIFQSDNGTLVYFRDVNTLEKEFEGNIDGNTARFNTVPYPVTTSQVLLEPKDWNKNIALRLELYGCEPGYYFKVWLRVLNTKFTLNYMDINNELTKYSEEMIISEVQKYLNDVPGFLFAKLHKFSPPLFIYEYQINQTSITAELDIYCIDSTSRDVLQQLTNSLANQRNAPMFGVTILHIQNPGNVTCQPPTMRISDISKDPSNAHLVLYNLSDRSDVKFILTAILDPTCNITKTLVYSWEIAFVDRDTGMFNLIYQFGRPVDGGTKKTSKRIFLKHFIQTQGLHYVRCIVRTTEYTGIHFLTYEFGFFNLVYMRPFKCEVTSTEGATTFVKFTLICTDGYENMEATGYTVTGLDSSNKTIARSEWGSPSGTINLPAGNGSPMQHYSVRVNVEARYFSMSSLFFQLSIIEPLVCKVTPKERTPTSEKFTLNCKGGYKGMHITGYTVTAYDSSNAIIKCGTSRGLIDLPAGDGNGMEDYNVRVHVEAKYLSMRSLFDDVFVTVNILGKEVTAILTKLADGEYKDAVGLLPNLQGILENQAERLTTTLSTEIKVNVTRGMISIKITSNQQLMDITRFLIFCNKIKEETTQEIQKNSLDILNKAVTFLNDQKPGSVPNINSITEILLEGAASIFAAASEDGNAREIEKLAMKTIYNICAMRRRFLRIGTDEEVRFHSKGMSVLLAKTKIQTPSDRVFRILGDQVRLPKDFFTGEWRNALQSGTMQIIRYEENPHFQEPAIIPRNVSVVNITFWHNNETRMKISNLSTPIGVVFSRTPQENTDQGVPDDRLFLKRKEMQYHPVLIPYYEAVVTVRIKPEKNVSLRVFVRHDARPTAQEHDFNVTLPNTNFSSCLNISDGGNCTCSSRDPYEFDLVPNVTSQVGRHFIGVELVEHSLPKPQSNGGKIEKLASGRKRYSCVKVKPAPPTPLPVNKHLPRRFNSGTDYKYKLLVTVRTCVFWNKLRQNWSDHGLQVDTASNETRLHCLTNHLSTFSGNFYVAPNKIDFDEIFKEPPPPENMVVLFTVCLIFLLYAIGLVFARRADNRDKMKVVNTNASSQKQEQSCWHNYEVSIQTGTTARVGIILFGEEEISDTIFFMDPWKESKLFTRGSVNTFTFDLPRHLGQVYKIKIWHDNSGISPAWFLYEVVVKDTSTNEKWHFLVNRWLAVESQDGVIDVEIKSSSKNDLTRFSNLFQWRAISSFVDRHLFLSIFARPPQNPFTRCQRLTCMLSIILVSLVTNAMFYRSKKTNDPNSFRIGPLELSLTQIIIGVQSGLIALPVNILTVMIFRNIRRNPSSDSSKENENSSSQRKQTQGLLPPCFVVVGWSICLAASIASATFAVFYSLQWGAEKSNRWLLSVGVSLLQEILLTGPIIILVNTSIMSIVNKKQTETNDIKEMDHQSNLVHVVQENDEVISYKPSAEELQTARSLRIKQRKMRRFFADLVLYVIFVVLLMTVCYANRKPSMYRVTKSLKDTFSGFYKVNDAKSFWSWFEEELVTGIYDSEQLVDGNETWMISSKLGFIVGLPRIRQMRIKPESTCKVFQVEPVLRTHFNQCVSEFSNSNKDTTPYYEPGWKPAIAETPLEHLDFCPEPWHYEEPMSVSESFLPYGGGGYVAKVGYDAATALMVKESLEENNWIDEMSAAVIVEFVVFEPANLLISDVMLLLEKFPSGMRRTSIDVLPEYIFPSSGSALRTFYRVSILLWFITILVLLFIEVVRCFKQGWAYFKSFFGWVSMLQILSSFCAVLMVFVKENSLKAFLQRIQDNPFGDWSAYELVAWSSYQVIILSIAVVTTTINCLKLIQLNRHVHVMKWTLQSAGRYLISFSIVIMMLAIAFAQFGTLLFGHSDEEYATLYYSLRTVLQMAIGVGKIQFTMMKSGSGESEVFAPIFLMGSMLSMTIIFVNTFIAILDEAFHQAKGKNYSGEELGPYLKSRLVKRIKETNSNSFRFRKSPLRKTVRKKYATKSPKREAQQPNDYVALQIKRPRLAENESLLSCESLATKSNQPNDYVALQIKRPRLAESESLLSCESLGVHEDVGNKTNTPKERKFEDTGMDVLEAQCADEIDKEISNSKEFYIVSPPFEDKHLLSNVATSVKRVFRKSPFGRTVRTKYAFQSPKHNVQLPNERYDASQIERPRLEERENLLSCERAIVYEGFNTIAGTQTIHAPKCKRQRPNEDYVAPQTERPRLAETESLSSYESVHEDFGGSETNTQATQAGPTERKCEATGMNVLYAQYADESEKGISKSIEVYLDATPPEEEHLLSDVATIVKSIRSDFTRSLWEDEEWYHARSSLSSCGDSIADMNESPSILNLVQTTNQEASDTPTQSYVRSIESSYGTVVKHQSNTVVKGESTFV